MFDLTPVKILLVLVVAMILLGPDKLPQVARQLGAGWRRLQELRERVDQEIRENVPDLPSSQEIARYARSPVTLLNQLATMDPLVEDPGAAPVADQAAADAEGGAWPEDPSAATAAEAADPPATAGERPPARPPSVDGVATGPANGPATTLPPAPDDPSLN